MDSSSILATMGHGQSADLISEVADRSLLAKGLQPGAQVEDLLKPYSDIIDEMEKVSFALKLKPDIGELTTVAMTSVLSGLTATID